MRVDDESKLSEVETLSKTVMSKSSSSGQEIILREVEHGKSDWNSLVSAICQVGALWCFYSYVMSLTQCLNSTLRKGWRELQ